MAAWTEVTYLDDDDLLTNAWVDMVAGNLAYLLDPNVDQVIRDNSAEYTTTSTSFVDVDATNVKATITTNGGPVLVCVSGSTQNSNVNQQCMFDIDVDGTRVGADHTFGLVVVETDTAANWQNMSFSVLVTGLGAGAHTFKLQWRVSANTGALEAADTNSALVISAIEL